MSYLKDKGFILKAVTLFFCVTWFGVIHHINQVPVDVGDGLMHFNISQASWSDPINFLHHWGKPLFILLSSTFSQFGYDGIIVFNIIVFALTVLVAWKILNKLSVPIVFQCVFPLILINVYEYSSTVVAGLTEPLFSLFIMIAIWFILTKKWMWFALIVSFIPFLRSEGQLAVVLALFLLIGLRQFKYIPFLFVGFVIYGIIGFFALGDFMWYFTMSPYHMGNGVYGSGPWNSYLISYKMYLGNVGLIIFILAFLQLTAFLRAKKWGELQFPLLFFTYGIFFGVLISHSYFWATGSNGSLGLNRIATQGMPSFVLINIYYITKIPFISFWSNILKVGVIALSISLVMKAVKTEYYPVWVNPLDTEVMNAVEYLRPELNKNHHFFFHHPLFVFKMGGNPLLKNQPFVFYYCGGLKNDVQQMIKPGDYIIRDSHFGPVEQKLYLSEFDSVPEMVKIKTFVSELQEEDKNNEVEGVMIYQYRPKK